MKSVGIDIVQIDRIRTIVDRHGLRFLNRVFTETEIEYCQTPRQNFRYDSLAARFAAKEAFYKAAFPLVRHFIKWHECEVINDQDGVPSLKISKYLWEEIDGTCLVSLSHSEKYAIAIVSIV